MKTLYTLLILIFASSQLCGQSSVTFKVDLSEYTGPYTQVNLNGTFNSWCGSCANMLDDDGDDIWEITVTDLPSALIEYKFTLDGWDEEEIFTPGAPCTMTSGMFTNRVYTISGDATLDIVCWENCASCDSPPVSADVTFRVDMTEYTGTFGTVNLNGTFNSWCGACAVMTDDNGDDIYEITTNLLVGVNEYKFTIDGWDGEEILTEGMSCTMTTDGFTNRILDVSEEIILPSVCWESCNECGVGINELDFQSNFGISPNPSRDEFNITISDDIKSPIYTIVYNMLGEPVLNMQKSILGNFTIDLSSEPVGIYFVKFDDGINSAYKRISKVN
ncbi:MAG: hypothetical protein ACI8XB_001799 [Patiriisocius sp.]|jgi:hypothetical protein